MRFVPSPRMLDRLLARLAAFGTERPRAVLGGALVIAALSVAFAAALAHIETDIVKFLPDEEVVRAFGEAREIAREPGTLYALLEADAGGEGGAGDPAEALLGYAAPWATALRASGLVASVEYAIPEVYERFTREVLIPNGFLYLEGGDLDEAIARLEPEAIQGEIASAAARLRTAAPVQLARLVAGDPLGLARIFARRLSRAIGAFRIDAASGYLLSPDRRALLVKVVGRGGPGDLAYARSLFQALAAAEEAGRRGAAPGAAAVRASYTGGYAFAIEDERSIARDIYLTVGTSVVTVLGIFVIAFRRARAFAIATAPLFVGIAAGVAAFVALRREVTIPTAAFVSVVVGLAIDFPIHLLARYLRERRAGRDLAAANEAALRSAGGGAVPAGLMTGAAFLTFALTGFRGLADLGIMAGLSMIASLGATLAVFPALTAALGERDERRGVTGFGLERLWKAIARAPGPIVGASVLATAFAAGVLLFAPGPPVILESDLRNLRPEGARAFEVQEAIGRRFGGSFEVALAVVHAPGEEAALETLARARRGLEALRERGAIAGWESPERYLPSRVAQEAALLRLRAVDPAAVEAALREALAANGFKVDAFAGAIATLRRQLRPPGLVARATLEGAGVGALLDALGEPAEPGAPARALLSIFPPPSADRATFEAEVRAALVPAADRPARMMLTGTGAVVAALARRLERDFVVATTVSVMAVFAIALVHFRRVGDAVLATVPVVAGFLWMLAVLKAAGIPINFMNVIVFPMIIGIEDNAVHVLHRWREREREGGGAPPPIGAVLADTGLALFLCTATTMLGFGSLVLSSNRGIASIGAVMLIAKATCWVTGTVALPAWLEARVSRSRSAA